MCSCRGVLLFRRHRILFRLVLRKHHVQDIPFTAQILVLDRNLHGLAVSHIPRHTIQIQTADLISFFRFYDNCPRLPFFRHCAYLVAFIFLKLCIASLSVHDKQFLADRICPGISTECHNRKRTERIAGDDQTFVRHNTVKFLCASDVSVFISCKVIRLISHSCIFWSKPFWKTDMQSDTVPCP